ncbi:MAG TPA: GvpL/GvpF family gas vesicle protein [Longimicrobiaceae bacterium]|nr:GvpL/GvpF family gas vesicle protein [Longimicrobiaceae bacterium]
MILHAYCIRRAGEPPPDAAARGIGGAGVAAVEEAGLAAWVSALDAPPPPEPERLREHDRVVRSALSTATPLPLRYGAAFRGEDALRAVLRGRAAELLAALDRVHGRVEMGLAVGWDAAAARERVLAARPDLRPPPEKPATGRAYLESRRREHALDAALRAEAGSLLDRVSRALSTALPDAEEARVPIPQPDLAGTLAHLVLREQASAYRAAAHAATGAVPEADLRVSGPWAPYSFV